MPINNNKDIPSIEQIHERQEEQWWKRISKLSKEKVELIRKVKELEDLIASGAGVEKKYLLTEIFTEAELQQILKIEQKKWEFEATETLTADFLNKFLGLNASLDSTVEPLEDWLAQKGAIKVPDEILKQEENLSRDEKGTYLLPWYFKEVSKIDDYKNPQFCAYEEKDGVRTLPPLWLDDNKTQVNPQALLGHWCFGTGTGKTTKLVNCMASRRPVIVTSANSSLIHGAYDDHTNEKWLQGNYTCVLCNENHGRYNVDINKIVQDKDGNFVDGVSIMEPSVLTGYLVRALLTDKETSNMKLSQNNDEEYKRKVDQIKHKETLDYLKRAIIVFDEAHYSFDPAYQKLIERTILLGYDVIKMSATFESMPFSTTSSYNIDTVHVKNFGKEWDEKFANTKTLLFLKSTEPKRILGKTNVAQMMGGLTEEQKRLLKKSKIPYVILDKNYESAAKGIVDGLPKGSLIIVNPDYEMGHTLDVGISISTGEMEIADLTSDWCYKKLKTKKLPFSSLMQQRGRVGRTDKGIAVFLSKETQEVTVEDDAASALVRIATTPFKQKDKELADLQNHPSLKSLLEKYDFNRMKQAVAWPDHFGKKLQSIIVGWAYSVPYVSFFGKDNKTANTDEEVWSTYTGESKELDIDKVQAKEILKLMIATFLKRQTDITKKIEIDFSNPLIGLTGLNKDDARGVLNAIINKVLNKIFSDKGGEYLPTQREFKNREVWEKVVDYHWITKDIKITNYDKQVSVPTKRNPEGVKVSALKLIYNAPKKKVEL